MPRAEAARLWKSYVFRLQLMALAATPFSLENRCS